MTYCLLRLCVCVCFIRVHVTYLHVPHLGLHVKDAQNDLTCSPALRVCVQVSTCCKFAYILELGL